LRPIKDWRRAAFHMLRMLSDFELILLARKMIDTMGDCAADKMDAVVAAHVEEGNAEGAQFWGAVADVVRGLEKGSLHAGSSRR